jgi:hypothetical protein
MSVFHPKAAIELELTLTTATDPYAKCMETHLAMTITSDGAMDNFPMAQVSACLGLTAGRLSTTPLRSKYL